MNTSVSDRRPWQFSLRTLLGVVLVVALLFSALKTYIRWKYPYGSSHCCILQFTSAFWAYANDHNGFLPAGEKCPEASLSQLYYGNYGVYANLLRGKTVPLETVQTVLARDKLLGPDTCGWHYVEGLTVADDPRIAVIWDKVGLGHNGERLSNGGHEVLFLGGSRDFVSGAEWPEFLKRQEQLLAARTNAAKKPLPVLEAKVRLPSGKVVDQYSAQYTLTYASSSNSGGGSGTTCDGPLAAGRLRWWSLSELGCTGDGFHGTLIMTLTLGPWSSKPVQIDVAHGVPTPRSFIFDLTPSSANPPGGQHAADTANK